MTASHFTCNIYTAKCHSTPEADLNISEDRFGRTEKSSKSHINTTNSHFEILKTHFLVSLLKLLRRHQFSIIGLNALKISINKYCRWNKTVMFFFFIYLENRSTNQALLCTHALSTNYISRYWFKVMPLSHRALQLNLQRLVHHHKHKRFFW